MGNVRLPKPTPLGWGVAAGIAVAAGAITFLVLHSPIVAVLIGLLGAAAFVMTGPRPQAQATQPAPVQGPAVVPAQRVEAAPAPVAVAVPIPVPAPAAAPAPPVAPASLPADPLDQVSLLSAYVQEEPGGYQPSYAPEAPTLVARVPGQTLTLTGPDLLATAFVTPGEDSATDTTDGTAWRMGMDILPQSRSSALAVGNRLGSFRSAVVKARREAKRAKPAKAATPKPPPGKHRAG